MVDAREEQLRKRVVWILCIAPSEEDAERLIRSVAKRLFACSWVDAWAIWGEQPAGRRAVVLPWGHYNNIVIRL